MRRIKMIGHEILGLFVEDARFTAALAIWIALAAAARPWWQETQPLGGHCAVCRFRPDSWGKRAARGPSRLTPAARSRSWAPPALTAM